MDPIGLGYGSTQRICNLTSMVSYTKTAKFADNSSRNLLLHMLVITIWSCSFFLIFFFLSIFSYHVPLLSPKLPSCVFNLSPCLYIIFIQRPLPVEPYIYVKRKWPLCFLFYLCFCSWCCHLCVDPYVCELGGSDVCNGCLCLHCCLVIKGSFWFEESCFYCYLWNMCRTQDKCKYLDMSSLFLNLSILFICFTPWCIIRGSICCWFYISGPQFYST